LERSSRIVQRRCEDVLRCRRFASPLPTLPSPPPSPPRPPPFPAPSSPPPPLPIFQACSCVIKPPDGPVTPGRTGPRRHCGPRRAGRVLGAGNTNTFY
jgi:hypothetical protein